MPHPLRYLLVACLGILSLSCAPGLSGTARAAESGASHYSQGAYGDFLMAFIPGPGFALRSDTIYQSGHMDGTLKGGRVYAGLDQTMTLNVTTISRMFEVPAIGGFLGLGFGVPVIFNEHVTGDVTADYRARSRRAGLDAARQLHRGGDGDRGGLSDIFFMPVMAGWNFGECSLTVTPMVFLPTGYYDKNALTSLGMNYVTFDGNLAFTWLAKKRYELSFNAGYMINTENPATHYLSGNQFHLDWTLAYHVNERLAFGAVGYVLAQTTPDTGTGATMGGFYSSGTGLGPAVTATLPIGGKDFTFVAKWLHGLCAEHSFRGETVYGSLLLSF
ncbi:conserved hypothetical protein [Solidesulfovibrio fructosivorans JJ]]|uniref:MetA-pathway of phenol degradation n=1 Tax=Solidesulfovibrio fructosivorans JJ] TaxID=596151 RepID=E1JY09_SOLFR|nr:transporter [Solidesulfovibrio fructosivorans]EFL50747.1 conserved hypothetical protein [Solidesulfovibrio fructosivorans JJ]]